jgi:hypothetical protein
MEESNIDYKLNFTSRQKTIGELFYIFIVIACLITIIGGIWSIFDFVMPHGKLDAFILLNLGYQIAIIAGFLAGLFFLLIFFFGLFKKGRKRILMFTFSLKEIEEKYKNRLDVKIAAGGLLLSLMAIIIGIMIAIIQEILGFSSSTSPFSGWLASFSSGNWILFVGVSIFVVLAVTLFLIYFWKNGYYLILKIMGVLEK